MAKYLAQLLIAGAQVVGRAFNKALREELTAVRNNAASRQRAGAKQTASTKDDAKMGISLEEATQILDVDKQLPRDQVNERYQHLFAANDKSKGGSFYLQSKVVRAKERIDQELDLREKQKGENVDNKSKDQQ